MGAHARELLVSGAMALALSVAGAFAFAVESAFADGGSLQVATVTSGTWQHDAAGWHYLDSGNNPVKGDWVVTTTGPSIGGLPAGQHRYWIDADGLLAQNRVIDPATPRDAGALAPKTYVYATQFGFPATGRTVVGNNVYLSRANGKLETGNKRGFLTTKRYGVAKGKKARLYYINPKTHAITFGEPVKVSSKFGYVYAPNSQGYLLRGLKRVDKNHVVLAQKNGRICNKKGWLVTSRYAGSQQKYRIERTSKNKKLLGARIGMFKVKGKRYYGKRNGALMRDTWKRFKKGGKLYRISKSGVITVDKVVSRMIRLAQRYSSRSRYLIMVDIDDPRVVVFQGSRGRWRVKYIWNCCTGARGTPTVVGTFSIGIKGYSFGEWKGYSCYYYSQISGDYLFHSQMYYPHTRRLKDGAMGRRCSHGCVRLNIDNAHWIYSHVPSGTTVACIR